MSRRTKPVAWGPSMVPTARRDLTQSLGAEAARKGAMVDKATELGLADATPVSSLVSGVEDIQRITPHLGTIPTTLLTRATVERCVATIGPNSARTDIAALLDAAVKARGLDFLA